MILAFKKEGWFSKKKVLIFLTSNDSSGDHIFLELPAMKKYYAAANLELFQIRRLRDFLSMEINKIEDSTDDNNI